MAPDPDLARQGPLVLASVLKAAEVARIGVAVSVLRPGSSECVYATATAAELLGVPLDALVGHSLRDFLADADVAKMTVLAREMVANPHRAGSVLEVEATRPDGQRAALELAYAPIEVDGQPAVVTFLINVGEQRAAQRDVEETKRRLEQLIEQAPDAIVISRRGVVLEANPAAARILGLGQPQALVGRSLADFLLAEDAAAMGQRMAAVARGEPPGSPRVYRANRPDGSQALVEIASFASEYGGLPAITALGRDVTERERLREQLARTERLAALGTLAAGVAHEINNPLSALVLNAEVVARVVSRATLSERDRETGATALKELQFSVERMTAIVRDLTGFSRESTEQFGPVNVGEVVARALRVTRHATRQRATVRLEAGPVPQVLGHAGKLEQVVVNLVVNAAQALPEARGEAENEILIRISAPDERHVALEIRDNGPGIPPEVLGRVFDPFFTTKPAGLGTGLGLFISHNAVQQMEGELTVESQVGQGTTMRVLLPAPRATPQPAASAAATARPVLARGRVLIIDDEPSICRTLGFLLRDAHDVTAVEGGAEALKVLASGAVFDVVLCDLMMPSVSGLDVFAEVNTLRPELVARFVFMTGGAFTAQAQAFLTQSANICLRKPFAATELEAALQRVMSGADS